MTSRRALVTLPEGVWKIIDEELKGKIGDGDSEVIRNVVISHLTERGYLMKGDANSTAQIEQIAGELDMHDNMITSLVEILEEKGHVTYDEWERRVKKKVTKK